MLRQKTGVEINFVSVQTENINGRSMKCGAIRGIIDIVNAKNRKFLSFTIIIKKEGDTMVELDQFKYELSTFQKPLVEVRDSL